MENQNQIVEAIKQLDTQKLDELSTALDKVVTILSDGKEFTKLVESDTTFFHLAILSNITFRYMCYRLRKEREK